MIIAAIMLVIIIIFIILSKNILVGTENDYKL